MRRTFITPFDRTDIQDLISSMDDAIDQMNKTAKVITLFEVRSFDPQMQELGEIILQAANLVLEAMPLLSSIGKNSNRLNALTERSSASRSMPIIFTIKAARRYFSPIGKETRKAMRWASSSGQNFTITWRRWLTVSRTSRTRSTHLSSITFDG